MQLFRRRRALVCREAVELVTSYLDGALSAADRVRFEAHIADCPHCSTYLDQIRTTIALCGGVEAESLNPQVQDDLIAVYRKWTAR